jgi:hypothetical protein
MLFCLQRTTTETKITLFRNGDCAWLFEIQETLGKLHLKCGILLAYKHYLSKLANGGY